MVFLKRITAVIVMLAAGLHGVMAQDVTPKAKHYAVDDIGQFVPALMIPAVGLCGVKGRHDWRERIAVTATAFIINEGLTFTLKRTIHSTRPDGTDRHSFPSGHSSRAFAGAEIVRAEYGWGWGAGAYAVAAGVGALRIHHKRHRFGDVAGGAAVGFLSARAAYLLLPVERRLFGWDKTGVTAVAVPNVDLWNRSAGVSACIIF